MEQNKTGKYLKYAIGEIILVVIGILIAIQINNKNQESKSEAKIDAIFEDIMDELALNIEETTKVIRFYKDKDSMASIVLFGEIYGKPFTKKNILNSKSLQILWSLPSTMQQVFFSDKAFTNLASNADAIPTKYTTIFKELYILYAKDQMLVKSYDVEMKNKADSNVKEREQFEWYSLGVPIIKNEGFIDYVLNDFRYKNKVRIVYTDGILRLLKYTLDYRNKAISCYQKIGALLNKSNVDDSFKINQKTIDLLVGTWKTESIPDVTFTTYVENDRLYSKSTRDTLITEFIPLSDSELLGYHPEDFYYVTWQLIDKKIKWNLNAGSFIYERVEDTVK